MLSSEQNFAIKESLQTLSSVVMFDTVRVNSPEVSTYMEVVADPHFIPNLSGS